MHVNNSYSYHLTCSGQGFFLDNILLLLFYLNEVHADKKKEGRKWAEVRLGTLEGNEEKDKGKNSIET